MNTSGQSSGGDNGAASPPPLAQMQRPAQVLLGWLSDEQVLHFLSSQRRDVALTEDQLSRARAAKEAVARRKPAPDQSKLISPMPDSLAGHVAALRETQAAAVFFNEGWSVNLVDLRKVCALQPQVFTDHALERAAGVDPKDVGSLASVSLPLPSQTPIPGQFDPQRQAWIISAPNPNLRIIGNFGGNVQPGVIGFGFAVALLPSFLQVARVQGRFVLRDGYHRAYGFLERGVHVVPAFVREYGAFEDLGLPPGLFPPSVYLGERPPLLEDYFNDKVSERVNLPATQKMIVIHGLELTPFG